MKLQRAALIGLVVFTTNCGGALGGVGGAGGVGGGVPDVGGAGAGMTADCNGDFGSTASAAKLEAFLAATGTFVGAASELENSLTASCRQMGTELGIPEAEMAPSGDTPAVRAACTPVVAKLRSELQDLRATAHLTIVIEAVPPVCEVSVDAYAQCAGHCDASFDPGSAEIQCEGGEIRGGCSAQCSGSCSVEASGHCAGACEGTCGGGCSGTCNGTCEGTCSTRAADGSCAGRCSGTCGGTCSAGCSGSCTGHCVVQAQASCQGECRGGCSVHMTEPRCTGTVRPPSVSADCQASCDAELNAHAECTPGSVRVNITGRVGQNFTDRVAKLRAALQGGYGAIMAVAAKLRRLAAAGTAMVRSAGEMPGAVRDLGLGAARCVTEAAGALPHATATISVSVEVSASVGGSVGSG